VGNSKGPPDSLKGKTIGVPSTFVCPDCGGTLFEINNQNPIRYRCHTGNAITLRHLASAQEQVTDSALWKSLRTMQEKRSCGVSRKASQGVKRPKLTVRLTNWPPHRPRCAACLRMRRDQEFRLTPFEGEPDGLSRIPATTSS
jgi:hypothetical protein